MKALISPDEIVYYFRAVTTTDAETGEETTEFFGGEEIPNGARIAEVSETEFQVGGNLYWVDCNTSVNANDYYYDTSDNTIKLKSDF
jgi:hypothetical protein